MGSLPAARSTPSRPFTHTGLDYAGPFYIRTTSGRGHKAFNGYFVIFLCMAIKAVHIEVVSDYTTAAFLAAFKRFTARRGLCRFLYSDNGTNLQGADAELRRLFSQTSSLCQEVAAATAADGHLYLLERHTSADYGRLRDAHSRASSNGSSEKQS